jgi:hypothetical protein
MTTDAPTRATKRNLPFMDATFDVTIAIPRERLYSLIVSANEQGSGYWARVIRVHVPDGADTLWMDDPGDLKVWPQHGAALCGGSVLYGVVDDATGELTTERCTLDSRSIARGLQVMQEKHPRHFFDVIGENDDAETADVFLQCCLLGKVQFG